MKYEIPCSWQMYGYTDVEADSLEEAIEMAYDAPLPEDGDFVDSSFEIDFDGVSSDYPDEDY